MKKEEQKRENFKLITAAEFQDNEHELISISQNTSFKEEINNLKQEKLNHQVLLHHCDHS